MEVVMKLLLVFLIGNEQGFGQPADRGSRMPLKELEEIWTIENGQHLRHRRQGTATIDCRQLTNEHTPEQIVQGCSTAADEQNPVLVVTGRKDALDLSKIDSIALNRFLEDKESITFPIILKDSNAVSTLTLDELTSATELTVTKNPQLKKLSFPGMNMMDAVVSIQHNQALSAVDFDKLTTLSGSMTISHNSALLSVKLGTYATDFNFKASEVSLFSNPKLETIHIVLSNVRTKLKTIKVRGNRLLSKESIKNLVDICDPSCDIQGYQECVIEASVTKLNDLNDCQSIYGDLVLDPSVSGDTTTKITKIDGNMKIIGTQLSFRNLEFLEGVKITGNIEFKDNQNMCGKATVNQMFSNTAGSKTIEAKDCPTTTTTTTTTTTKATTKTTTTVVPGDGDSGAKENTTEAAKGVRETDTKKESASSSFFTSLVVLLTLSL